MPIARGSTVALFLKPGHTRAAHLAREVEAWLTARGFAVAANQASEATALAVALGGDGTILHAARQLHANTPVLAVHLGTLGFLAETPQSDLYPSLEAILAGRGGLQYRSLLCVELVRDGVVVQSGEALNETVVGKGELARIIHLEVLVDGERVGRYRADGVIVATPTGSTGYSLSAGGPVLHPALEAIAVTPICPHSLTHRPLIVRDSALVEIELHGPAGRTYLTLDGQDGHELRPGDHVRCRKSPRPIAFATAAPRSFYDVLRAKLHWG